MGGNLADQQQAARHMITGGDHNQRVKPLITCPARNFLGSARGIQRRMVKIDTAIKDLFIRGKPAAQIIACGIGMNPRDQQSPATFFGQQVHGRIQPLGPAGQRHNTIGLRSVVGIGRFQVAGEF